MRVLRSPAFWVIVTACCLAVFANLGDNGGGMSANLILASDRPTLSKMATEETIMREGAILTEVKGRFRKSGERYLFVEDTNSKSYKCLENLCLQRVAANQKDDDRKVVWLVSAKVTEYQDENFLILEKAVRGR